MSKWLRRPLLGVLCCAALLLALAPLRLASGQGPVKVKVEITDSGFNPGTVEVEQGSLVELTFVWAHKGYTSEEHIMVLPGYKLESDKLTADHREATLRFVADKAGSFNFKCDLDCELHNYLQLGELKVRRSGTGGAASASSGSASSASAFTPTTLTLKPSMSVTGGDAVAIMAVLKDTKGAPVSKAEVRFAMDAAFAGTKGKMDLGTVKTDANGVAYYYFRPTFTTPEQKITATFEGVGVYSESEQAVTLVEAGAPPSALPVEPIGLETIRHWAPAALVGVVATVWAVFVVIMGRTLTLSRVRSKGKSAKQ